MTKLMLEDITDIIFLVIDAGRSAKQGDDAGQQQNPGGGESCPSAQTGAQERTAHQTLQQSAGEL